MGWPIVLATTTVRFCYAIFDRVLPTDLTQMAGQHFRNHRKRTDELVRLHGAVLDISPDV